MPLPAVGLRARVILMALIGMLPAVLLFWVHMNNERAHLLADAQSDALRLAHAWAEHHDERIREAGVLLGTAAQQLADLKNCGETLDTIKRAAQWPSAPAARRKISGTAIHSISQGPVARS